MNLIVFGATGMIGRQLIKQAIWRGHHVKAFGRNVHELLDMEEQQLELVKGALFDEGEVYNAIKGCDAVLSAPVASNDVADKTRSLGMKNILKQMQKANVKRIVAVGGIAVLSNEDGTLLLDTEDFPPELKTAGQEHLSAYRQLEESGLDWTFVCPAAITDAGPAGSYVTKADQLPEPNNDRINAGDLAQFMINELERNEFVKQRVGISN